MHGLISPTIAVTSSCVTQKHTSTTPTTAAMPTPDTHSPTTPPTAPTPTPVTHRHSPTTPTTAATTYLSNTDSVQQHQPLQQQHNSVQQHQPLQQQPIPITHRYSPTTPTTAATTHSYHTQIQSNNTNHCSNNPFLSHTDTVQQHQPLQQQPTPVTHRYSPTTPTTAATTYCCHAQTQSNTNCCSDAYSSDAYTQTQSSNTNCCSDAYSSDTYTQIQSNNTNLLRSHSSTSTTAATPAPVMLKTNWKAEPWQGRKHVKLPALHWPFPAVRSPWLHAACAHSPSCCHLSASCQAPASAASSPASASLGTSSALFPENIVCTIMSHYDIPPGWNKVWNRFSVVETTRHSAIKSSTRSLVSLPVDFTDTSLFQMACVSLGCTHFACGLRDVFVCGLSQQVPTSSILIVPVPHGLWSL